jgi:pyruvate formate lyase activating enzyme
VFLQGCNFKCPFCHNPELVYNDPPTSCGTLADKVTEEEVFGYLVKKKKMLDGVCITGGEPTLHADLIDFIVKLKKIGYLVKLDTNGSNPKMLKELFDKKLLDYVAMDLKAPFERYSEIVGLGHRAQGLGIIENCKKSFKLIQESSVDHEFRTTVFPQEHIENDFMKMAGYLKKGEKYYLQNIRYIKNLDQNLDQSKKIDIAMLLNKLKSKFPDICVEER